MKRVLSVILACALSPALWAAAPIPVNGRGEADNESLIGGPSADVVYLARQNARINAIEKALENQSEALREQFKTVGRNLKVEDYESKKILTETKKYKEEVDAKEKKVRAYFEGKLDMSALRDALNAMPAIGTDVKLSKIGAALFFTGRITAANIVTLADVTKSGSKARMKEAEGKMTATENGTSVSEVSEEKSKENMKVTSADTADKAKYELDPPGKENFGTGLLERFSSKGFEGLVEGGVLDSSKAIDEDFGAGKSVEAAHLKAAIKEVKEGDPEIKYVIVGSVDFTIPSKDPVTGKHKTAGTVNGKVYDISKPSFPKVVAAVGPVTKSMVADTQADARTRVIAVLAEEAADDIITKLGNKKGL